MELQWPLILFTTLVAWSAGLFGTQALMAVFGVGKRAQVPAWVCSAVLLAAGGIAVFFHLEHWERIFNGFGHLTSGITQELIAIVVLAVVAVAYLVLMRKSEDGASAPKWLAWLSVALSAILVAVMAHSYTMAARPAWDSVLWILYVLGNACVLGPATFLLISTLAAGGTTDSPERAADAARGLTASPSQPPTPSQPSPSPPSSSSPPAPSQTSAYSADAPHQGHGRRRRDGRLPGLLLWLGAVAVGAIVPLAAAFQGRHRQLEARFCRHRRRPRRRRQSRMRVAFYNLGSSVFMFPARPRPRLQGRRRPGEPPQAHGSGHRLLRRTGRAPRCRRTGASQRRRTTLPVPLERDSSLTPLCKRRISAEEK